MSSYALVLVGCENGSSPMTSGGDFNPLKPPGSGMAKVEQKSGFTAGQITKASMNNTAFYIKRPSGAADADKLLSKGTSMKIISEADGYVKVELDQTGEVGWVLAVQLENPNAAAFGADAGVVPAGITEPLPLPDPSGMPPGGAIPAVLDPNAPATPGAPDLKVDPVKENFDAPKEAPKDAPKEGATEVKPKS